MTREESKSILWHFRNSPCGRHYSGDETTTKVLQSGFFWSSVFSDAHEHATKCDQCQRMGNISRRNDCWGIEFVGPLPPSYGNEYILVAVDYVSKWVETVVALKNDAKSVVKFLKKNIFSRFGVPRVLISYDGSHFCNSQLQKVLGHYSVTHKVASPYHPQTNSQAKVSNRELKKILEKTVASTRRD